MCTQVFYVIEAQERSFELAMARPDQQSTVYDPKSRNGADCAGAAHDDALLDGAVREELAAGLAQGRLDVQHGQVPQRLDHAHHRVLLFTRLRRVRRLQLGVALLPRARRLRRGEALCVDSALRASALLLSGLAPLLLFRAFLLLPLPASVDLCEVWRRFRRRTTRG